MKTMLTHDNLFNKKLDRPLQSIPHQTLCNIPELPSKTIIFYVLSIVFVIELQGGFLWSKFQLSSPLLKSNTHVIVIFTKVYSNTGTETALLIYRNHKFGIQALYTTSSIRSRLIISSLITRKVRFERFWGYTVNCVWKRTRDMM